MTGRIRNIQPCHVTWQGIAIAVTYERDWLVMDELPYQVAHLTITAAGKTPLPFTETGFQSRFLAPAEVDAAGGPTAYVCWHGWTMQRSGRNGWARVAAAGQLTLF
jgi:hypothetical protein